MLTSSDNNEHGGEVVLHTKVFKLIVPQGMLVFEPAGKTRMSKAEFSDWDSGISCLPLDSITLSFLQSILVGIWPILCWAQP